MKTQGANVAVIALIIVIVAITSGIIGWMLGKNLQLVREVPTIQSIPIIRERSTTEVSNWKTYTSSAFKASISLPSDWKLVLPDNKSLVEPNESVFDGNIISASFSSPDKEERVTFSNNPFKIGNHTCSPESSKIVGNNRVWEEVCTDTNPNEIPGHHNYLFEVGNLLLVTDKETVTTNEIIARIRFNENFNRCTTANGKAGFIMDGRNACYAPGENIPDTDCVVSPTGGCKPLGQ